MPDDNAANAPGSPPLPLQAFALAGTPSDHITPALIRAVEQWCDVLPLQAIINGLRRAHDAADMLEDFRQAMLCALRSGAPVSCAETATPPHMAAASSAAAPPAGSPSAAIRRLIAAQDKLEAMSDAEYQSLLARRLKASANKQP